MDAFQQGRIGEVIAALPELVVNGQALEDSATGSGERRGWVVSARVHHLAASTLAKVGEADLAWISAERAMYAADQADDPLVLASAARAGVHALLAVGRYDDAMTLGSTASGWLTDRTAANDPAALSLVGMLHLRAASAAARRQNRAATQHGLEQAAAAAAALGVDANFWRTSFGPTNVKLHEFSTALDLGDIAYVVDKGPKLYVGHMPIERAVAHHIDVARAMSYVARDDEALAQLLVAERRAPQLVRHSVLVRETVRTMHRRAPATASKGSALFTLAERCRAVR